MTLITNLQRPQSLCVVIMGQLCPEFQLPQKEHALKPNCDPKEWDSTSIIKLLAQGGKILTGPAVMCCCN